MLGRLANIGINHDEGLRSDVLRAEGVGTGTNARQYQAEVGRIKPYKDSEVLISVENLIHSNVHEPDVDSIARLDGTTVATLSKRFMQKRDSVSNAHLREALSEYCRVKKQQIAKDREEKRKHRQELDVQVELQKTGMASADTILHTTGTRDTALLKSQFQDQLFKYGWLQNNVPSDSLNKNLSTFKLELAELTRDMKYCSVKDMERLFKKYENLLVQIDKFRNVDDLERAVVKERIKVATQGVIDMTKAGRGGISPVGKSNSPNRGDVAFGGVNNKNSDFFRVEAEHKEYMTKLAICKEYLKKLTMTDRQQFWNLCRDSSLGLMLDVLRAKHGIPQLERPQLKVTLKTKARIRSPEDRKKKAEKDARKARRRAKGQAIKAKVVAKPEPSKYSVGATTAVNPTRQFSPKMDFVDNAFATSGSKFTSCNSKYTSRTSEYISNDAYSKYTSDYSVFDLMDSSSSNDHDTTSSDNDPSHKTRSDSSKSMASKTKSDKHSRKPKIKIEKIELQDDSEVIGSLPGAVSVVQNEKTSRVMEVNEISLELISQPVFDKFIMLRPCVLTVETLQESEEGDEIRRKNTTSNSVTPSKTVSITDQKTKQQRRNSRGLSRRASLSNNLGTGTVSFSQSKSESMSSLQRGSFRASQAMNMATEETGEGEEDISQQPIGEEEKSIEPSAEGDAEPAAEGADETESKADDTAAEDAPEENAQADAPAVTTRFGQLFSGFQQPADIPVAEESPPTEEETEAKSEQSKPEEASAEPGENKPSAEEETPAEEEEKPAEETGPSAADLFAGYWGALTAPTQTQSQIENATPEAKNEAPPPAEKVDTEAPPAEEAKSQNLSKEESKTEDPTESKPGGEEKPKTDEREPRKPFVITDDRPARDKRVLVDEEPAGEEVVAEQSAANQADEESAESAANQAANQAAALFASLWYREEVSSSEDLSWYD